MKTLASLLACLLFALVVTAPAVAEDSASAAPEHKEAHHGMSADEVAKELANPNTPLASLTFKNQYRWYKGDLPNADDQSNYTLLFQPVFPFTLEPTASGGKPIIFLRPAIPLVVDQPVFNAEKPDFDDTTAMGDIGFDIGYGVTEKSGLLWAFGAIGTLPTATDEDVAGKQLRLGPEAVIAQFGKKSLFALFPKHQWDVTGWSDSGYFSTSEIQVVAKWLPGKGISIGSSPIMDYDWKANQWTIPLNLTASKTSMIGKMPVKWEIELNYYVEQPDPFGPEWMIGLNITPVVPNIFDKWIKGL